MIFETSAFDVEKMTVSIYKLCDRGMIQNLSHNYLNFKMIQFPRHGEKLSEVYLILI